MTTPKRNPAILVEEFSSVSDSPSGIPTSPDGARQDWSYVHGYSDKRRENDQRRARGESVVQLPWRLQYVSVEKGTGVADARKRGEYSARGYIPVLFDECGSKFGIDPEKSGFVRAPDGTCRAGSQMLMAAPAHVAAREAKSLREATEALSGSVKRQLDDAATSFNQEHGLSAEGGTAFTVDETLHKG